MPLRDRSQTPIRKLLYVFLALALSASGCGASDDAVDDAQNTGEVDSADDDSSETTAAESEDNESESPESSADESDADGSNSDGSNPATSEIRELISAQSSIYGWDNTQTDCIADGVIATGVGMPGDLDNDVYAEIIVGCNGMRGQLEFAMGFVTDPTVANCVVDSLSDDEINALGTIVLEEPFEAAEAAMSEAVTAHPDCG